MPIEGTKRKLVAILSADVKGYSRLMGEDEKATVETIKQYRKVMGELIQQHSGRVVDTPGDNLLAEFQSVVDAVGCAVNIQPFLNLIRVLIPAMANNVSEGSRTAVRTMANRCPGDGVQSERSDAVLKKIT